MSSYCGGYDGITEGFSPERLSLDLLFDLLGRGVISFEVLGVVLRAQTHTESLRRELLIRRIESRLLCWEVPSLIVVYFKRPQGRWDLEVHAA